MGYDPDRFDHVDKFWVCHLCNQILKDPVLVCLSDHVLCRDCTSLATMCPWPDCEERVFEDGFRSDVNMARFIATLVICCEECEWRGPIMEDANHAMQCEARRVQCPNMNCTETILAGTVTVHLETCPETLVSCANNPACTHTSRRANIFQHGLRCEFNPCRWHTSGCGFRGSTSAVATHEAYCTKLHEELARLRARNMSLTELKNHRVLATCDEMAPILSTEEIEVIDDGAGKEEHGSPAVKASRRNRSHSKSVSATVINPDPSPRSSNDPASTLDDQDQARIEKEKRREKRRARRAMAVSEEATLAEAVPVESIRTEEEKRIRKEEKAKRRAARRASREAADAKTQEEANSAVGDKDALSSERASPVTGNVAAPLRADSKNHDAALDSIKSCTLSNPVSLMENALDKVHFSTTVPPLVQGVDADSIVSGGNSSSPRGKALAKNKVDSALTEHLPDETKNNVTYLNTSKPSKSSKKPSKSVTEANAEPTTPTKAPSSMKKRDREEAGLDGNVRSSTGPKPKKVRIRLPSPFLQPDTDEDTGEEAVADGLEDRDPNVDLFDGELDSDSASDGFGELVVTPVPVQAGKLAEEGEVEDSINVVPEILPTPASLLAKYNASKPIYMQAHTTPADIHHAEDVTQSFASAVMFSQQYPDFSITPFELEDAFARAAGSDESGACYSLQ